MDCTTMNQFRHAIYGCFGAAKDALFNTVDALLTEDRARSFVELALSPRFERRWPSLYEGLEDGTIDQQRLGESVCSVFARTDAATDRVGRHRCERNCASPCADVGGPQRCARAEPA